MSISTRILIGLVLGIASGLFFGETMGALSVVGDAYVGLLQMTVLPYVVVSLIAGLGSLTYKEARLLALRGGSLLALLWFITFVIVLLMPLSFPELQTGSFFSTTLVERPPTFDLVSLYVPSNPFESLANSDVPAVVLFSIALGVALMGVEEKGSVLRALHVVSEALMRVTRWIVRLTPYGVFAIGASAAGTMTVDEFGKVQVYLVSYIAFALVLTFWVLPGIVATLTGLPQREIASAARDALITAFATGNDFVVLPLLTERTKEILAKHRMDADDDTDAIVDVVVPVSHNFPHTAKILSLSFIVFAGWFTGNEIDVTDYPALGGAGVVSTFGSVNLAIPFLLDLFHLPSDLFNLFVATSVVNARFGTLLAAMHGFSLALLVTAALTGRLVFSWVRILRFGFVTLAVVGATVVAVRGTLGALVDTEYDGAAVFDEFQLAQQGVDAVRVFHAGDPIPERTLPSSSRIEAILTEDTLRACYNRPTLPFRYFEKNGSFVGLDVEMAYSLARGLGTGVEFVPTPTGNDMERRTGEALARGDCDLVLGMGISMDQSKWLDYSHPYLDLTMALLVPDHRRGDFVKREQIERMQGLRLGLGPNNYYERRVRTLLPNAELVILDRYLDVLDGSRTDVDAIVHVAEIASAYSLLYPSWSAIVPDPPFQQIPVAFGLPEDEPGWRNYVNSWLHLKKRDGTIELLYDHWVLGRGAEPQEPRWSILRDVLHWTD